MKNLFDMAAVAEINTRLAQLRPDSPRQWGKMNVSQMVAHCANAVEMAVGDKRPPRMLIGRIIGGMVKQKALGNEEPLRKNTPTAKELVITDDRNFEAERKRLSALIERFVAGGPKGCTSHPHMFFGPMTSDEWAVLMYKHLDHHLRQFGV